MENRDALRRTTLVESRTLNRVLGCETVLVLESLQHTGSFKFRAAWNVVRSVPHPRFIAASSGNFGQALACAAQMLGRGCTVVMPNSSAKVKVDAVRSYGATADLIDTTLVSRSGRVVQLAMDDPDAYVASAYDDPLVIAGNATLAHDLVEQKLQADILIAPLGGGGLTAGLIRGFCDAGAALPVVASEPLMANDGARSLRAGHRVANETEPPTIADGARTLSVGNHNWAILQHGLAGIVEPDDATIARAVRVLYSEANVKAEPTGALSIAALLAEPERFEGMRVACVISGGNVDPAVYAQILTG